MPENQNSSDPKTIERMFDSIAHRYDFLNHLLSFGIDRRWRKKLRKILNVEPHQKVLDVATGSGDILSELMKENTVFGVGCDRSGEMLRFAKKKLKGKNIPASLIRGDAFRLPFKNDQFDVVTIGFGIRNMNPRNEALGEIRRILKPGGRLAILEFFPNQKGMRGKLYKWYAKNVIPRVGRIVSGSNSAYMYLPDSIRGFPDLNQFEKELTTTGYLIDSVTMLTFGIVSIVVSYKAVTPT